MSESKHSKNCLVLSYGPVPTPQYQTVEGGGMRAWGLSEGLRSHGLDVTVGVNASFPQEIGSHEGVKLVTWSLDANFIQLINSFDAVIISYCMGDPSVFVAENINDNVQLILDAYVPIYIEVSARDSKDIGTEYINYMTDISRHNRVLQRGDYFLYANDAQELLYSGVLSALGVINPNSYRQKRLLKLPFGIHKAAAISSSNPYTKLGIKKNDFVVLWFGGIYPWFRIEEYLNAIKTLKTDKRIKFVFVGGKNPFNPNPDFSRQYDVAVSFAKNNKIIDTQMFFVDWVNFEDRINWYKHSDVIISINQPGNENIYSWRTRVMDYVWGEAPTISNGGDPLSNELINKGAAILLNSLSSQEIVNTINKLKSDPSVLSTMKRNVNKLKKDYYWDKVTDEVSEIIKKGTLPYQQEASLRKLTTQQQTQLPSVVSRSKVSIIVGLPVKIVRKVKQKGVLRTIKLANSVIKVQTASKLNNKIESQFVFISHPINNTGGPIVLLQIIEEYVQKYGSHRVRLIAPGVEKQQEDYLRKLGITVEQAVFGIGFRFIRLQLDLHPDDLVLINTTAIYDNYRDFILLWLRLNRLKHAFWFIHEDIAQLPFIHKEFLLPDNLHKIKTLVDDKKLDLLFPSKRTAAEYSDLIDIQRIHSIKLRVEVDQKYIQKKTTNDFSNLNFFISGTSEDGRKGQLLALSAFQYYRDKFFQKNPNQYRTFNLHLVAVTKKDYISQQIRWISSSVFGNQVKIYEPLPKAEALEIAQKSNVVICCSLNETFGLYIAEGMLMGHIVLRNTCAGLDEQLEDGKNGYLFDHTDIVDFAKKIEKLLNKETSATELVKMSVYSQKMMKSYTSHSYLSQINSSQ